MAQPVCGVTKVTDRKLMLRSAPSFFHVLPPSSVCSMTPSWPTAHPDCAVVKATECRSGSGNPLGFATKPLLCGFHVSPPSSVCRMVPFSPTIHPDCGVTKLDEYSDAWVPLVCCVQPLSSSSVCRIVPFSPTAQPECRAAKVTESNPDVVALFCHVQVPFFAVPGTIPVPNDEGDDSISGLNGTSKGAAAFPGTGSGLDLRHNQYDIPPMARIAHAAIATLAHNGNLENDNHFRLKLRFLSICSGSGLTSRTGCVIRTFRSPFNPRS